MHCIMLFDTVVYFSVFIVFSCTVLQCIAMCGITCVYHRKLKVCMYVYIYIYIYILYIYIYVYICTRTHLLFNVLLFTPESRDQGSGRPVDGEFEANFCYRLGFRV